MAVTFAVALAVTFADSETRRRGEEERRRGGGGGGGGGGGRGR